MRKKGSKDWKQFKDQELNKESQGTLSEDEEEATVDSILSSINSDAQPALSHPSYEELESQLTIAEQQAQENREKATRAIAELENTRRRAERDISTAHRYGSEKLLSNLIPVMDSLEQALQLSAQSGDVGMHEGLELTHKLFTEVLQKNGIQQLDPVGEAFNPGEHEAISIQESTDVLSNKIITVFQKGYKLYERVIRPARVIVAKNVSEQTR